MLPILVRALGTAASRGGLARALGSGSGIKGQIVPKITVDTRNFDRAFAEYLKFNKRAIPEIVNTKAYFIARNAVNLTKAVDKTKIDQELRAPSKDYPEAPLAAIIVAKQQQRERFSKKTGKRLKDKAGLMGSNMTTAINKLIRIRQNTVNFLRAGWISAIKEIEKHVPKKSGPSYKKVKLKGQSKGGAKGAKQSNNWKCEASIWNTVTGGVKKMNLNKKSSPLKVAKILEAGLQKAIDKEVASMNAYVEKKLNQGIDKFNRS